VTLQVGNNQVPAELPLDVPIAQLVDYLVARHAGDTEQATNGDGPAWQLSTSWGRPFSPDSSLADNGIFDGSVLLLANPEHPVAELETPVPAPPAPVARVAPPAPQPPSPVSTPQMPAPPPAEWQSNGPDWTEQTLEQHPLPAEPESAPESENGMSGEPALPQDRTRGRLPGQPRLAERLRQVAKAVTRPDDDLLPDAGAPEVPAPGRPISPMLLSQTEAPDAVSRARIAWKKGSYRWRLENAIAAPQLQRCVTIAMISPKGGVGKTTVTALLGSMLALIRRDRVVAIDANPDFGSLGRILTANHHVYVDDIAEVLDDPQLTVTALDQNLGRTAHGLMVLPAPVDPNRMEWLDQGVYARIIERLRQMVGVILLDCGTGLHDPASRAAISAADQVVLVSDPDPTTASLVESAAGVLSQRGSRIWLVVNKVPKGRSRLDIQAFGSYVAYARGLVTLPVDPEGVRPLTTSAFDWNQAPAGLRRGIAELAADLIGAWPEVGVA
jgi:MinD-like ATPase involved in chromosome partitioning or flagellar assembly